MNFLKQLNSYAILMLIMIFVVVLTWIVPGGEYNYVCNSGQPVTFIGDEPICPLSQADGKEIAYLQSLDMEVPSDLYDTEYQYTYAVKDDNRQGLWQLVNAPVNGFYAGVDIALFVIIIGGFLNLVIKSKAIDNGINRLLAKFAGDELKLIPILMIIFALGGTTFGMAEETIGFYLLIIPVFIAAGFDALVGMRVLLLGSGVGVIASTVNPFAIGAAVASSQTTLSIGDGIFSRLILLVIVVTIAIVTTINYAQRVRADITQSTIADIHEDIAEKLTRSGDQQQLIDGQKLILIIFSLTFFVMVLGVIPWSDFNLQFFENINQSIGTNIPLISGDAGMIAIGNWWFGELTTLFLVSAVIIGYIASKNNLLIDPTEVFLAGCKDLLPVALVIGLSRGITVIMTASGLDATLLYFGTSLLHNLSASIFTFGSYLLYFPLSFLIPSTSGLAAAAMPVMAPLANGIGGDSAVIYNITSFSAASGIVNLITPTSGVVMGGLALAQIPYDRWVKHILPTLIILFIVCGLFLIIGVSL